MATEFAEPQFRDRGFAPEATFTPTAAGLHPVGRQRSGLSEELKYLISQAIAHGVATTLQIRGMLGLYNTRLLPSCPILIRSQLRRDGSRVSVMEDDDQTEQGFRMMRTSPMTPSLYWTIPTRAI
ncbi:hypothetical protein E2320_005500 [Naja naja]|nr:hypothetical protein E2320_005500 [Naja naja]